MIFTFAKATKGAISNAWSPNPMFEIIFGLRPRRRDYPQATWRELKALQIDWDQKRRDFIRAGRPDWIDDYTVEEPNLKMGESYMTQEFAKWGMPDLPVYFEMARSGWWIAFPDILTRPVRHFRMHLRSVLMSPHTMISHYQVEQLKLGIVPEKIHPWIPKWVVERYTKKAAA